VEGPLTVETEIGLPGTLIVIAFDVDEATQTVLEANTAVT
jgi:hypothetical protein